MDCFASNKRVRKPLAMTPAPTLYATAFAGSPLPPHAESVVPLGKQAWLLLFLASP